MRNAIHVTTGFPVNPIAVFQAGYLREVTDAVRLSSATWESAGLRTEFQLGKSSFAVGFE